MNLLDAAAEVFQSQSLHAAAWGFASAFSLCLILVLTYVSRYVGRWLCGYSNAVANSITGALVGLLTLTAIIAASLTHDSAVWSIGALVALVLRYVAIYARMVRYRWCSPVAFLMVKPQAVRAR